TYSGTGVSGTTFNPVTAGVGTHTITYKHTDANSCSDSATQTIKVNALPTVSMSSLSPVCVNQAAFTLTGGSPTGGTYSGTGVSSGTFNPGTAGVGTHSIKYTYTDGNGCTNKDSTNQVVNAQPTVSLSSFSAICSNSGLLTLTGGSPGGGTYFGNNVSSGKFNPLTAGAGTHTINYEYSNSNGCKDTASQTIVVNSSPSVSLSSFANLCANADSVTLSGGVPSSGTYKINGSTVTGFNPTTYGKGSYTVWYSFTDGNSCTDSASQTLTVDSVTPLTYPALASICNGVSPVAINTATPTGGIYSGTGVTGNMFDPSVTGIGTFTIKYVFTNGLSCQDSIFQTIGVDTLPAVSFQFSADSICANADSILLTGVPSGGTFNGSGSSGSYFNPKLTSAGMRTITYTYTGVNGCSNSAVDSIRVDSIPVVSFNLPDSICFNSSLINLLGVSSPLGGTYSGSGVVSTNYNPSVAGVGLDTVGYKVTNAFGCSDSVIEIIRIDSVPAVSLTTFTPMCSSDSLILTQGMPSGGIYSGNGVTGNVFKPSLAGMYTVSYKYTDLNNCSDSVADSIRVKLSPQASLSSLGTICANAADFTLKNGLPAGGVYLGSMVKNDSIFSPTTVGAGSYVLRYGVADTNGCTDTASLTVNVDTVPIVSISPFPTLCLGFSNYRLVEGIPAGGKYYGTGVVQDTMFNQSVGVGPHSIKYIFSDINGCTDSAFRSLTLDTILKVTGAQFKDVCAYGDTLKLSGGLPLGGKYSGNGVLNDTLFVSESSRIGTNKLYYVIENHCGKDSMQFSFRVKGLPTVSLDSIPEICQNNGDYKLSGGTPEGGKYYVFSLEDSVVKTTYAGKVSVRYTYTDTAGCLNDDMRIAVIRPGPLAQIHGPSSVCSKDSLQLSTDSQFKSYIWNGKEGEASHSWSYQEMKYGINNISLKVLDDKGCSATVTKRVDVYNCGDPIEMWPNPSNGNFQMRFLSKIDQEVIITITNDIGQEILRATPYINPGNNVYDIVLSVGAGIYVVKVEMDGETHLQKIIIR
ncbi:MAG: hypothetical protein CL840_11730, partial [Crocinitomicaceae bacterium]|nr:hypothetical protein [Crocinitomicaceae bacterium]